MSLDYYSSPAHDAVECCDPEELETEDEQTEEEFQKLLNIERMALRWEAGLDIRGGLPLQGQALVEWWDAMTHGDRYEDEEETEVA